MIPHMKARLLLLLLCIALIACGEIGLNRPKPEIVGQHSRSGQVNFDYAIWVDCTVQNHGASGNIELTARLSAGRLLDEARHSLRWQVRH